MPLVSGPRAATPEGIRENIERLIAEGLPSGQAVAIAHHVAENERADNDRQER